MADYFNGGQGKEQAAEPAAEQGTNGDAPAHDDIDMIE